MKSRTPLYFAGWIAVAALVLVPRASVDAAWRDEGPLRRLLGPLATFAAGVEWVRFDLALRAGEPELAYARAQTALELDPGAAEGWDLLASHQAFDRAAPEREPEPHARMAWIRAALGTAERGEAVSRDPARLALLQGLILLKVAFGDPDLAWPGGRRALWEEAAVHLDRAAELGLPFAADLAVKAREKRDAEAD